MPRLVESMTAPVGPHATNGSSPGYRADIDGLRAIAVLAVVLYHAGADWLPGGFLGVDIFFVISGFVITTLLRAQLAAGAFTLAGFYDRRIRRILPALLVVLAVTGAVAWVVLPPPDIAKLGQGTAAAALFVFNLYMVTAREGYFSGAAQADPVQHTWSLAVEGQFYLLFPLLLLACRKWTRAQQVLLLTSLMALSAMGAVALAGYSPNTAFYFSGARAWELLLGSLLAFYEAPAARWRWLQEAAGLAGLALIAFGLASDTEVGSVQGALMPCVGAALVIWCGSRSRAAATRLLAFKPLVGVGLVSYSLYLWHWPLVVFYGAMFPFEPLPAAAIIAASLLMAVLSWRFIETPLRRSTARSAQAYRWAAGTTAAVLACAVVLIGTAGGDWRISPYARWLYTLGDYPTAQVYRDDTCFLVPRRQQLQHLDRDKCLARAPGKPNYLLIGDSHAAHLWSGLSRAFPDATIQQVTAAGCRPFKSVDASPDCRALADEVLDHIIPAGNFDAVVLSARWAADDIEPLRKTVAALLPHTRAVIVVGPIAQYRMPLPRVLALAESRNDASLVARARLDGREQLDRAIASALGASGAVYLSAYRALCATASGECITTATANRVPVQFDDAHLTAEGSVLLASRLRDANPAAWPRVRQ
ncbi:acyltransferase family protein [Caenimonas koreensis DSM 17982]|uniref:Acyltransferase family protein n=2 Tax=Caenimonas TaxID=763439 RepID=A0A844B8F3_9BURK|nr:acyltransferase family protein [Caenimonas koreensis DSM 17982]